MFRKGFENGICGSGHDLFDLGLDNDQLPHQIHQIVELVSGHTDAGPRFPQPARGPF
jgi:hypothetical protein